MSRAGAPSTETCCVYCSCVIAGTFPANCSCFSLRANCWHWQHRRCEREGRQFNPAQDWNNERKYGEAFSPFPSALGLCVCYPLCPHRREVGHTSQMTVVPANSYFIYFFGWGHCVRFTHKKRLVKISFLCVILTMEPHLVQCCHLLVLQKSAHRWFSGTAIHWFCYPKILGHECTTYFHQLTWEITRAQLHNDDK